MVTMPLLPLPSSTRAPGTIGAGGWIGLGLFLVGGLGLAGIRTAMSRNPVALLDGVDRMLAVGGAVRAVASHAYGPDPAQKLRMFVPTASDLDPAKTGRALPIVMFIHGGGWMDGDPHDYSFIARTLAPLGYAVVLAGYRLHPHGIYPAMLEDGAEAMRWIAREAPALGGDAAKIVLMGHSAGAYNAVMLALDRSWLAQAGLSHDILRGAIGLAGPYDFLPLDDPVTIATFGHADDPAATQPLSHVHGNAPPVLLLHGERDERVAPRHSLALARTLAGVGARTETHVIEGIGHEGLIMRFARPFLHDRRALDRVAGFLARVTASDVADARSSAMVQTVGA
ncbi:alpha/beta hydrolase [Novosphingobium nitrogenifigens]|nr:alpha/beta hydrolase [Novosphingobium nitrogenifigens]